MSKTVRLVAMLSIVVFVGAAAAAAAASDEKEVLMARCRATCALRHLPRGADADAAVDAAEIKEVSAAGESSLDERCGKKADCQMCWKTCAMIFVNVNVWGSMCRMPKRFCVSFIFNFSLPSRRDCSFCFVDCRL